jgi:phage/plasmid-like protein (TIGR03299 family)
MAHEVETMMYVGDKPWHGLGVSIPEKKRLSVYEALLAAGLDWNVELRHLYTEGSQGEGIGILDHHCTCRTTDNRVLGIVGRDYTPLQNSEAFAWFQPFLDTGMATLETAGSLKDGQKVWVLAKVRDSQGSINGDRVDHYILLSNAHDGSIPVRVGFTPIRVVCHNTLTMAHHAADSKLLRVKHTPHVVENLEAVRKIMNIARMDFYATIAQYKSLARKEIDRNDLERYVKVVFNMGDKGGEKLLPKVLYLFDHGRGSEIAGATYWGAYNAVTEYLNYFRGKTQDNTLNSLWYGGSAMVSARALDVALKMAA